MNTSIYIENSIIIINDDFISKIKDIEVDIDWKIKKFKFAISPDNLYKEGIHLVQLLNAHNDFFFLQNTLAL